jgi:hypothetical protein
VNTTQILTILIITTEMAYIRGGTECQAHIILDVRCNSFGLGMSIVWLAIPTMSLACEFPLELPIGGNSNTTSPLKIGGRKSTLRSLTVS